MNKVESFQGEFRFLSNFWPCLVEYNEITFPSVEHAYQAAKSSNPAEQKVLSVMRTPGEAKRRGRVIDLRPDWERMKVAIMTYLVYQKFSSNPPLRKKLLATGDAELIEGNTWGDRYWGVYAGEGRNQLGKILMFVRQSLREDEK